MKFIMLGDRINVLRNKRDLSPYKAINITNGIGKKTIKGNVIFPSLIGK
ncbi:hypothetical protein HY745_04990 [Candidatus Desantisbacteria bacterium]|nr:hypothetical protein [Candidatus Desantisbacteria bacterium]